MTQAAFPLVRANHAFTFGHRLSWAMAALGRLQPVEGMQCAGQVSCKGPVTSNANDWSVAMQTGGQVECSSPGYTRPATLSSADSFCGVRQKTSD
jgi:hypothetical protein